MTKRNKNKIVAWTILIAFICVLIFTSVGHGLAIIMGLLISVIAIAVSALTLSAGIGWLCEWVVRTIFE